MKTTDFSFFLYRKIFSIYYYTVYILLHTLLWKLNQAKRVNNKESCIFKFNISYLYKNKNSGLVKSTEKKKKFVKIYSCNRSIASLPKKELSHEKTRCLLFSFSSRVHYYLLNTYNSKLS